MDEGIGRTEENKRDAPLIAVAVVTTGAANKAKRRASGRIVGATGHPRARRLVLQVEKGRSIGAYDTSSSTLLSIVDMTHERVTVLLPLR
jgi:hypothetical protein